MNSENGEYKFSLKYMRRFKMHLLKRLLLIGAVLMFAFSLGLAGCKKEGPAERLGKKLDKAAEKAEKKLDDLKEDK